MTMYFSFVGDPDAPPFEWEPSDERYRIGNLPKRITPPNKGESLGVSVDYLMRLADEGRGDVRQIDWGAWAMRLTGAELKTMLADYARGAAYVSGLDDNKTYVLVAGELY